MNFCVRKLLVQSEQERVLLTIWKEALNETTVILVGAEPKQSCQKVTRNKFSR